MALSGANSTGGGAGRPDLVHGASHPALFGMQVLVVEDEPLVAMVLEDMLADFGCTLAGSAATLSEALSAIAAGAEVDAAILDVNLGGQKIFPVADLLAERGVPFVFSTGYGPADLTERYPGHPMLHKPYQPEELAQVLLEFAWGPGH